ncbi:beta-ketoacyl-ACP synthase III [Intrasporangium calvum]|uniref:Beta-ketoacyl-[acyl-carrier-protein] synthase III n=1 Tax=Intrasporangium calvum (strain ATCC 23552 / DSM 43043 / JCM 3097 / NBRC 12989 / NCIMB 10167 / NRRL B-3866 / 7 KIP) TaxID=710696 RepID=E6SCY6_INTC7|nr:3-oxoacyl-(acyl-carrier-protein) synthase III [Intrasporangium calvum DSM 43043]
MTASSALTPKGTGFIVDPGSPRHSRMLGVGAYRPDRVVMNAEIVDAIDSSDEWIRERSGIVSRHRAAENESVIDMAEHAARQALEHAGITADQLGFVLMATVTHPYQTPAAAPELAARLGSTAPAMDISAACAGYCYGVATASDMVKAGSVDYVLVIGVEKLSDFTDPHDRGTAFIFGDGAGACVIGPSDTPGIGPTVWGSDGGQRDVITNRHSWLEIRDLLDDGGVEAAAVPPSVEGVTAKGWPALTMAGQSVFRWAVWGMAPIAQQAIDRAGIKVDDLDAFIPHQANIRIVDAMVKQLKLPPDIPVARDIVTTANTSAASIPIAMTRMLAEGEIPSGGLALQIGFGAGLVYAAQVIVLP